MTENGIVDAVKVVRIDLQDAASIASLMITAQAGFAAGPEWRRQPSLTAKPIGAALMPHQVATSVIFPIENRMYGANILAIHLNALVKSGQIQAWHVGRWVDWNHREIEIGFDSVADAQLAEATRNKS